MRSIQSHSAFLPLHTGLKHKHLLGTTKLLWISTNEPIKLASHNQQLHLSLGTSCRAMHHYSAIVLSVTTPPSKSGDISVLLQVGGVLLFAYVFSNFIVPSLISEYFGFNKMSDDEEDEDIM